LLSMASHPPVSPAFASLLTKVVNTYAQANSGAALPCIQFKKCFEDLFSRELELPGNAKLTAVLKQCPDLRVFQYTPGDKTTFCVECKKATKKPPNPQQLATHMSGLAIASQPPNQQHSSKQVIIQKQVVVQQPAQRTAMVGTVILSIDLSGSMAGTGEKEARDGVRLVLQALADRKSKKDVLAVYGFSNEVAPLQPFGKAHKVDVEAVCEKIRAGGGTALHDGIGVPLDNLNKEQTNRPGRFTELCVFTDGEEAHSNPTLFRDATKLREKLANPGVANVHVTLLHVGSSSSGLAHLQDLAKGIKHVSVVSFDGAKGNIVKAFQRFVVSMGQRVMHIETTIIKSHTAFMTIGDGGGGGGGGGARGKGGGGKGGGAGK
jgi:Mg-chelatase subunit ChlD